MHLFSSTVQPKYNHYKIIHLHKNYLNDISASQWLMWEQFNLD